jgi:hypothetical protein
MLLIDNDIMVAARKAAIEMLETDKTRASFPFVSSEIEEEQMSMGVSFDRNDLIGGSKFEVEGKTFFAGMKNREVWKS